MKRYSTFRASARGQAMCSGGQELPVGRARLYGLLLLSAMIVLPAPGQQDQNSEAESYGRPNGVYYLSRDAQARVDILYGIEQGIISLLDEGFISKDIANRYTIKGFRFSDIKDQVDKLYEDKANLRIPIAYGYLYAIKRARGDSPREIENFLAELRQRFLLK